MSPKKEYERHTHLRNSGIFESELYFVFAAILHSAFLLGVEFFPVNKKDERREKHCAKGFHQARNLGVQI